MKTTTSDRLDPWVAPESDWQMVSWITRLACLLETCRPRIGRVLLDGRSNPAFHNLLLELANIDYEIARHRLPRYNDGEIVSPTDWGGHGGAK